MTPHVLQKHTQTYLQCGSLPVSVTYDRVGTLSLIIGCFRKNHEYLKKLCVEKDFAVGRK